MDTLAITVELYGAHVTTLVVSTAWPLELPTHYGVRLKLMQHYGSTILQLRMKSIPGLVIKEQNEGDPAVEDMWEFR